MTHFVLETVVAVYTAFVLIFGLWMLGLNIKYKFRAYESYSSMFLKLNKLHGRKLLLRTIQAASIAAPMCWLALAGSLIDAMSWEIFSHFDEAGLITPFGEITHQNEYYYFGTLLFGIVGVKGSFVISRMAKVLVNDYLGAHKSGAWGPVGASIHIN